MDWYTVIPTKDRPAELGNLVDSLMANGVADPSTILIINNGKPSGVPEWLRDRAVILPDGNRGAHIYQQWNWGLDWAQRLATGVNRPDKWPTHPHAVAILNDDVELPADFAARMIECLRDTDVTIAFPDQGPGIVNQPPPKHADPSNKLDYDKRITGYAFVVNGKHGIRCDENFKWWYGDDDLDWQARRDFNGTWEVDVTVKHLYPSESTNADPERAAQAARDRETFISKWGKAPW